FLLGPDDVSDWAAKISATDARPLVPRGRTSGDPEIIPPAPPAWNISKEAVMAELARVEDRDIQLKKNIARLETPRRFSHIDLVSSPISGAAFEEMRPPSTDQTELMGEISDSADAVRAPSNNEWYAGLAQEDWFRVSLVKEPSPKLSLRPAGRRRGLKTFLVIVMALVIPAGVGFFLFSRGPEVFRNHLAGFGSKIISASSYTLVNSAGESAFPGVVAIKKGLPSGGEATALIDQFLAQNSDFGWLNIFKKKIVSYPSALLGLEFLEQAQVVLAKSDSPDIKASSQKLQDNLLWLKFWQGLVGQPPKQYLIVALDESSGRPMGGRPLSYALVKLESDGLAVVNSGRFSDLDAASAQKTIPPRPLQAFSTSWLPSEAGWFWNFQSSAETLLDFFEKTTQLKADGLIAVSRGFLKDFSFRQNLLFDADSSNWFYGLSEALARKPETKWPVLAESLKTALEQHRLQFYFREAEMQGQVAAESWSLAPHLSKNEDGLGVVWANWRGGGVGLDLWENSGSVFEDGSVVVKSNIFFKQSGAEDSKNYVKIYLPLGAQILKAEGFSPQEKIPDFDYASQGFTADYRLDQKSLAGLEPNKLVEVYQESDWQVLGGWISLIPQERRRVSVEYVSPVRLDYSSDVADYHFKIWRPHQTDPVAFRFNLAPQKGIEVLSLEPSGFISEGTGEYQGSLSKDLSLRAQLRFDDEK
ncbi:MAG: DUF4012 domain-containing protein, partial [Parcubacteria group bacterium]|nr:DUF4012 domain-containing protein [Parcubacteria group bacterium]